VVCLFHVVAVGSEGNMVAFLAVVLQQARATVTVGMGALAVAVVV